MPDVPRAVEREYGHGGRGGFGGGSNTRWGTGAPDDGEETPEWAYPESVRLADKMWRTDAQISATFRALTLPIRRTSYRLDPGDARPELVERLADDLALPVSGAEAGPIRRRTRDRFAWSDHLRLALLSLVYGHMAFEQVYRIDPDGFARIRKLAPRMPTTISKIDVASDGGLVAIEQSPWVDPASPGNIQPVRIPVDRLVMYVNDRIGAAWQGQSVFRSAYKHWLLKERMIRLSAITLERNGMGVPTVEGTAPGATATHEAEAQRLAEAYRAGEGAGGYIPYGFRLRLVGVEGSLPDPLPVIKYHDEQIARNVLAMFMQLGSTDTGSRALGQTFVDTFVMSLQAVLDDVVATANQHIVEDWVDINYGPDEPAPMIVATEIGAEQSITAEALNGLMQSGAITSDPELEAWIRRSHRLPQKPETTSTAPSGQAYKYDLDYGIVTINERRAAIGLPPIPGGDVPPTPPEVSSGGTEMSAWHKHVNQHRLAVGMEPINWTLAAGDYWRDLLPHERLVDFAAMDRRWRESLDRALAEWKGVRAAQLDELMAQIVAAVDAGDIAALGNLTVTTGQGVETLTGLMTDLADAGVDDALAEAQRAGRSVADDIDRAVVRAFLPNRAAAVDALLSNALVEVAGRTALRLASESATVTGEAVAAAVRSHIEGLSDTYLTDQLGGALTSAQNTGRMAAFEKTNPVRLYASELLDASTCDNCAAIDGTVYDSRIDAEADYPTGGYAECRGGARCRGTLVAVYDESAPTVD